MALILIVVWIQDIAAHEKPHQSQWESIQNSYVLLWTWRQESSDPTQQSMQA